MAKNGGYLFELNDSDVNKIKKEINYIEEKVLFAYRGREKIVTVPDEFSVIGAGSFALNSYICEVLVKDNVKLIGASAFYKCTSLTKIEISDSVKWIEAGAFRDCTELKSIDIGKNICLIEPFVFENSGLETINIDINNEFYKYQDGLLYEMKSDESKPKRNSGVALLWANHNVIQSNLVIPEGIEVIAEGAFSLNKKIREIKFPESLRIIENQAFSCSHLNRCYIPRNVYLIEERAFEWCHELIIECHRDTYAHKYAEFKNIKCKIID